MTNSAQLGAATGGSALRVGLCDASAALCAEGSSMGVLPSGGGPTESAPLYTCTESRLPRAAPPAEGG